MPYNVLAFSGSLRAASSNTGLVRMAQRLAPPELEITLYEHLRELPFYDNDLDTPETLPPSIADLRAKVIAADAILFASPEYNASLSGALKNAFDWVSRPMGGQAIKDKVIAIVSSGGKGGGMRSQEYFSMMLGFFGNTMVSEPPIAVPMGMTIISADGTSTDPAIEDAMRARLANMVEALKAKG